MRIAVSVIIVVAMASSLCAAPVPFGAAAGGFAYSLAPGAGVFDDVEGSSWYSGYVRDACGYGFFRGVGGGLFLPGGLLTYGEAVTLAARLHSLYHTGEADFPATDPFYSAYAGYALAHGIIGDADVGDYSEAVRRSRFAELICRALPPEAIAAINEVSGYAINDVMPDSAYGDSVYALYRAGVLSGSDGFGTFFPYSEITRAEASAIMVRTADPDARVRLELPAQIPAEDIFQRSVDAVFMIDTYDGDGQHIRSSTGFFISPEGLALTNMHVFEFADSATVTLGVGGEYQIRGLNGIDYGNNIAVFSVEPHGGAFSFLNLADSDLVTVGNTVYALGNPMSLANSLTSGIVSHPDRLLNSRVYIQFSAPISYGSGGSPLLNALGQVIGIASSSLSYGQNINLAVPVNLAKEIEAGEPVPLKDIVT